MPWKEITPMNERFSFVQESERGLYTFTELCVHSSIRRKTGYN